MLATRKVKNRKVSIRRGDEVVVISGKDRGKQGKVERVISSVGKVVIAGVNIVKRHQKSSGNKPGGIIEKPAPIDIGNVMLLCPKCGLKTRIGRRWEGDKKVRICKKCGKEID